MNDKPLTRDQSRRLDRIAVKRYGMDTLLLMENVGRGCVDMLERLAFPAEAVLICCGKGNNGGDGFVMARHLRLRGRPVEVLLCASPEELTGDALVNYEIARRCDVAVTCLADVPESWIGSRVATHAAGTLVDALLGTGAIGHPRSPVADVIRQINALRSNHAAWRVLAIDIPSGLDADLGRPGEPTVRADATVTMVTRKTGFSAPEAIPFLGAVQVVDIGCPFSPAELAGETEQIL